MNKITRIISIIILVATFVACKDTKDPDIVLPLAYLPAYPGSYWDYSNGERVLTSSSYILHNYQPSVSSTDKTADKYVPEYNGQYLYEYSITQNSTTYPIKKLLEEKVSSNAWLVNQIAGQSVMRQVSGTIDSLIISMPTETSVVDSIFRNIVVVVEFLNSMGFKNWNTKEYYAKDVGLIRVEINDPYDEAGPVLQKEIKGYFINK